MALKNYNSILNYFFLRLEKLNDFTTTQFFRCSNRKNYKNQKNGDLKQFFQKRARLEFYKLNSEETIESDSLMQRKLRIKNFFLETDLFNI